MVSIIMPGMVVLGTNGNSSGAFIDPYGTGSASGTGGARTYELNVSQTAGIGSSTFLAYGSAYHSASASGSPPYGGTVTARTQSSLGDFLGYIGGQSAAISGTIKTGWGGSLGNVAMLWGVFPQGSAGAPDSSALTSLCNKTIDIPSFNATQMTGGTTPVVRSLTRLNDPGLWADSGVAEFTGSISGTALTVASTQSGSTTALAANTIIAGPGITGCPNSCPKISSGSGTSYVLNASGGTVSSEAMKAGSFSPAKTLASNTVTASLAGTTLTVTALPTTPAGAAATFTGTLNTTFTGSMSGTTTLTVSAHTSGSPVLGVGTTVYNGATLLGTVVSQATIGAVSTGGTQGLAGTYVLSAPATVSSGTLLGSGILPTGPTNLTVSSVTGTIQSGQFITDGGASLTGPPLLITGGSGTTWTVLGNYYPAITSDTTMVASLIRLYPGNI